MDWQRFDRDAERYESWYETAQGQRSLRAETLLLDWLLGACPGARTVLDVGCGCGRFSSWLQHRGLRVTAVDRSPGMLACLRRRLPACPAMLADAHALPLPDEAVDVVLFVTTLEFLQDPERALAEAVRVARTGVVALVLNRWSTGALSRRFGPAARGTFLPFARDFSPRRLRSLLAGAAGTRLVALRWRCALLPRPLPPGPTALPCGDVVGAVAALRSAR